MSKHSNAWFSYLYTSKNTHTMYIHHIFHLSLSFFHPTRHANMCLVVAWCVYMHKVSNASFVWCPNTQMRGFHTCLHRKTLILCTYTIFFTFLSHSFTLHDMQTCVWWLHDVSTCIKCRTQALCDVQTLKCVVFILVYIEKTLKLCTNRPRTAGGLQPTWMTRCLDHIAHTSYHSSWIGS